MSLPERPDYGRRLLPNIVDDLASTHPDLIVYSIPLTKNPADGFKDISSKTFANAVNRAAFWLVGALGKSESFETLGYQGPGDLRYFILFIAAIKCGYKVSSSILKICGLRS